MRRMTFVAAAVAALLASLSAPAEAASPNTMAAPTAQTITTTTLAMPTWVPSACKNAIGKHNKVICVGIRSWQLVALQNHRVVLKMSARHGAENGHYASDGSGPWPTRRGSFRIYAKYTDKVSTLYHVHMPYFMPFSGGQGIHYSSEYAAGYRWSHGCVGLKSMSSARALFNWAEVGTTVIVVNA